VERYSFEAPLAEEGSDDEFGRPGSADPGLDSAGIPETRSSGEGSLGCRSWS